MGSHRAALVAACARTHGPIIEIGAGYHSTPLLHDIAVSAGRRLLTVERIPEWAQKFSNLYIGKHSWTPDLQGAYAMVPHWSVALVDGEAEGRAPSVLALLPRCDYIVVHDTELLGDYPGMDEALAQALFSHTFKEREPWTTIVSDFLPW